MVADVTRHGAKKVGSKITSKITVISVLSEIPINVEEITNKTTSHTHAKCKKRKSFFLRGNRGDFGNFSNLCTTYSYKDIENVLSLILRGSNFSNFGNFGDQN